MMGESSRCQKIIQTYYAPVYQYCYTALAYDAAAAEDCTQEVFLVFLQKQHMLDLTTTILPWLYTTAKIVVRNYRRKNPDHEDLQGAEGVEDASYSVKFQCAVLRSYLTEEEYRLLYDYYNAGHANHSAVAKQYGMQLPQLYERVSYIKRKLRRAVLTEKEKNHTVQRGKKGGSGHAK